MYRKYGPQACSLSCVLSVALTNRRQAVEEPNGAPLLHTPLQVVSQSQSNGNMHRNDVPRSPIQPETSSGRTETSDTKRTDTKDSNVVGRHVQAGDAIGASEATKDKVDDSSNRNNPQNLGDDPKKDAKETQGASQGSENNATKTDSGAVEEKVNGKPKAANGQLPPKQHRRIRMVKNIVMLSFYCLDNSY